MRSIKWIIHELYYLVHHTKVVFNLVGGRPQMAFTGHSNRKFCSPLPSFPVVKVGQFAKEKRKLKYIDVSKVWVGSLRPVFFSRLKFCIETLFLSSKGVFAHWGDLDASHN